MDELDRLRQQNEELRQSLRSMIAWSSGGACSDCTMFRRAPSDIEFRHSHDCGYLEEINKACVLLGYPPDEGHRYADPLAEMSKLAEERTAMCRKLGLIK
jgi:hypothetical protein